MTLYVTYQPDKGGTATKARQLYVDSYGQATSPTLNGATAGMNVDHCHSLTWQ